MMEEPNQPRPILDPTVAGQTVEPALDDIRQALRGLRFGQITIIVQDGVVVQVERTERKRLRRKDG